MTMKTVLDHKDGFCLLGVLGPGKCIVEENLDQGHAGIWCP